MKSMPTNLYVLWILTWCVQAAAVRAQDHADTAEANRLREARQLHRAAVDDFANGAYLRAVDGFIAADRLTPKAAFLFNIAKCYDALHETSHALAAYRAYLRQAAAAPDARQVAERVSELSAQRARQGVEQVSVLSEPLGAQVYVDDQLVGSTPITVDLASGPHIVSMALAGYRTVRSSVIALQDQVVDLNIPLVALDAAAPSPEPATRAQALARTGARPAVPGSMTVDASLQIGGFVSLGAGIAALGTGIAFEVLRAGTERSARHESVQTQFAQDLDTIKTQQTLARVFAGSGVVLAAVGGVLLGVAHASSERKQAPPVSIACMPSHCQGVLSGVF